MNEKIEKIEQIDAIAFQVKTVDLAEVETLEETAGAAMASS